VQAETARYRIPDLSEPVLAELDSISATAREALTETRALLSVLRGSDDDTAHAPQPGLAQIGDLLEGARRAGMTLTESVDCPEDGVRPGTQLALYRIVQESLANAARHAPGAAVRLTINRRADGILVQVRNAAGSREPETPGRGVGHGLTGMRERVAAEGGTIETGETADGGFRVTVHLPLAPGDPVPPSPDRRTLTGEVGLA
jgi:signal transduction histidine kinase